MVFNGIKEKCSSLDENVFVSYNLTLTFKEEKIGML